MPIFPTIMIEMTKTNRKKEINIVVYVYLDKYSNYCTRYICFQVHHFNRTEVAFILHLRFFSV